MQIHAIEEISKDLQKTFNEAHDDILNTIYYGKSSDNKVKVAIKGNDDIDSVKIDPSLLNPESKEVLEKNIIEAITLAIRSSRMDSQSRFIELMKKLGFPGM